MEVQFNGPVGQTIIGGKFARIDTTITMGDDDEKGMVVLSTIESLDEVDNER